MTALASFLVLTYLLAAVPFGLVLTTLYGDDTDLRSAGSGNIGATNVARVYGWHLALPVLLADMSKGLVPTLLAMLIWPEHGLWWPALVAATCFGAHCFSVYLDFRGGKGVATGAGALLALSPTVTLVAVALWVTLLAITGRSSVAALGAAISLTGLSYWLDPSVLPVVVGLGAGIAVTHLANIRRLVRGEEAQVVNPVRWGKRGNAQPDAAALLQQGPAGGSAPSLWRESTDPLESAELPEPEGPSA